MMVPVAEMTSYLTNLFSFTVGHVILCCPAFLAMRHGHMSQPMEHRWKFHMPLAGLDHKKSSTYDSFSFSVCSLDVDAQGKLAATCKRWQILCEPGSLSDSVEQSSAGPCLPTDRTL